MGPAPAPPRTAAHRTPGSGRAGCHRGANEGPGLRGPRQAHLARLPSRWAGTKAGCPALLPPAAPEWPPHVPSRAFDPEPLLCIPHPIRLPIGPEKGPPCLFPLGVFLILWPAYRVPSWGWAALWSIIHSPLPHSVTQCPLRAPPCQAQGPRPCPLRQHSTSQDRWGLSQGLPGRGKPPATTWRQVRGRPPCTCAHSGQEWSVALVTELWDPGQERLPCRLVYGKAAPDGTWGSGDARAKWRQ